MDYNADPKALAAQNSFLEALKQRLMGGMLGQGMVQNAANAMQGRPQYLQYMQMQQSQGMAPIPFEEWQRMQQMQQQPRGLLGQ